MIQNNEDILRSSSEIKQKRILVGHPYWGRGGAEIAALWMLQALLSEYRVDVVTRGGWDIDELNRIAGTNVDKEAINVHYAPFSDLRVMGAFGLGFFKRYCRKIAGHFDLCITASRVIDWGVPAIHCLSDVTWNYELQQRFQSAEVDARKGGVRKIYWMLADLIAGTSDRNPELNDVFVANSQWTAKYSENYCSNELYVIAPPVPGAFQQLLPWDNRENSFVCLGRISKEKRIENIIMILGKVRVKDHSIKLHLVGRFGEDSYSLKIRGLCDKNKGWIVVHNELYGNDKEKLLGRCRYGINACDRESFGISTAEMIRSGVIPFVPRCSAQQELLNELSVCYDDDNDPVKMINDVLMSQTSQINLHKKMLLRGNCFTTKIFCSEFVSLVRATLKQTSRI